MGSSYAARNGHVLYTIPTVCQEISHTVSICGFSDFLSDSPCTSRDFGRPPHRGSEWMSIRESIGDIISPRRSPIRRLETTEFRVPSKLADSLLLLWILSFLSRKTASSLSLFLLQNIHKLGDSAGSLLLDILSLADGSRIHGCAPSKKLTSDNGN
jgi:hypothetical protein